MFSREHQHRPAIASHSFQYGVGVFDGIMAYWNVDHYHLHLGPQHYERFITSSRQLGFKCTYSSETLVQATYELLNQHPSGKYYVRPIIYRPDAQIMLTGDFNQTTENVVISLMEIPINHKVQPIKCEISEHLRVSGRAIPVQWKVFAAYTNSYLARITAEQNGFDDGIMLNSNGDICEASAANIFFIDENNTLVTPFITKDIFPGLTRTFIINLAKSSGLQVVERTIKATEVSLFLAAFLAATLMEIKPIYQIASHQMQSENHPVIQLIRQKFTEAISV